MSCDFYFYYIFYLFLIIGDINIALVEVYISVPLRGDHQDKSGDHLSSRIGIMTSSTLLPALPITPRD